MKITFRSVVALLAAMFIAESVSAQVIGDKELREIQSSFKKDVATTAIQNVLTGDKDIKSNALNRDLQGEIDHFFKYKVKVGAGVTDQEHSGRCWMFTSTNALRPAVMEKYGVSKFQFSHNYLYFWDIFEKSNLFLENIIATASRAFDDRDLVFYLKSPIGDGGVWNLYYNVASKYGVVPQEVMPETAHSNNTDQMLSLINEVLRGGAYKIRLQSLARARDEDMRETKTEVLKDVYRILALCLGEPPVVFTWRYTDKDKNIKELKNYTPKQFYNEITPEGYGPENYVMIMNDPTREFYKIYEVANYRNTYEGVNWVYLNLPAEDIKKAALKSIKNNESMYASCDVGKQFNSKDGILDTEMYDYESLFGIKLEMNKKARILTRQSGSSHAMNLVACDTDENDVPTKWEFENSWGASSGNAGSLTFTDAWFNEYLFRIVIRKNYLDSKAIDALDSKPIQLPAWDYMF